MLVPCPRCQQQNYPNASQCAYCGAPLSPSMAGSTPSMPGGPPNFPSTGAPGFSAGSTTGAGGGGQSGPATSTPQIGQVIDHKYKIERVLGEGGMGVVYVALDVNTDQRVVIKSIRPEFANRGDFRERTIAEGRALAKIDHQNVVRFYSIVNSPESGELYIVMQFIEGESLDRTLEKANAAQQKLPIPEVIRVFKQILDGVGAAHLEGLIHRDLKPANVLVRAKDGVAKVMDFGIAKTEGATKGPTQAGGIVGSLWYMAPEQIKGARDLDKRLDVYALGVVLYELTTGVVPFDGETEYEIMSKHMTETIPSVRNLRPDAPEWIDQIITRATQKERNARFQSCEEMRAAIDGFDGGIVVPRSATSYDHSILTPGPGGAPGLGGGTNPYAAGSSISMGGGTVAMSAGGSTPQTAIPIMGPVASSPQKKGGSGLIIGLVVVLLAGGGVGAYFAFGTGDAAKKPKPSATKTTETKTKDPEKHPEHPEHPEHTTTTATKPPPPKDKDPLDALVGNWRTDGTNRDLVGERNEDEVDFKVVDESQFEGNYKTGETRFIIERGPDGTLVVTDRYRPNPSTMKYKPDSLASCIKEYNAGPHGEPLKAVLKGKELTVDLVIVKASLFPGQGNVVESCELKAIDYVTSSKMMKQ